MSCSGRSLHSAPLIIMTNSVSNFHTKWTGVVHDVIDTNCFAQSGSTDGCIFATFKRRYLTIYSTSKLVESCSLYLAIWVYIFVSSYLLFFLIPFISAGSVMLLCLGSPLTYNSQAVISWDSSVKSRINFHADSSFFYLFFLPQPEAHLL